ncbi:hypothetical protein DTL42_13535 [Bremerella cremea]|uniref:Uncharacterized protein n=1 Tax=Bremerella cremea TaxID=1031537 RepID=A0A368KSW4_9BACT|nr:hypothetical protein [Bremerella cremea]RCS48223.1 hypothetical protein DTL42_13535 [Bremerella cremea]
MASVKITRSAFLADRQGNKFADVVNDAEQPFETVLEFFSDADRQRRMEESELHHDRAPLAGVIRELEAQPEVDQFLAGIHVKRSTRLRQAIGVLVRMIMERRGWQKTGKKGSLGVRAAALNDTPKHNSGGLAFWFVRAERYERTEGTPFKTVQQRCQEYPTAQKTKSSANGKKRVKEGMVG